MKIINFIGVLQIVIGIVFVAVIMQIDPGASRQAAMLSKTCKSFSTVIELHKENYKRSVDNFTGIKNALNNASKITADIAPVARLAGTALKNTKNRWFSINALIDMGVNFEKFGDNCREISSNLAKQSEVLDDYQQNTYPQTITAIDNAKNSLDMCADKLSDISSASRTNITYIGILAGVFFILNGIVLIIVAKNISAGTVKP